MYSLHEATSIDENNWNEIKRKNYNKLNVSVMSGWRLTLVRLSGALVRLLGQDGIIQ